MNRILAVDDEEGILEVVSDTLSRLKDADIVLERDGTRAMELLASRHFDLLITDIRMPGVDGIDLLRHALATVPGILVLMLTAYPSIETAVETLKLGAVDYIIKPFIPDDLLATVTRVLDETRLRQENRVLRRHVERQYFLDEILGTGPAMQSVFETVQRVAGTDVDVLIVGETGTGKELVARSIHKRSSRSEGRFVPVDCGAIPDNLLESEFFGHEKGAFTGAHSRALGLLDLADGGTFFLDEIAELPAHLQSKLLRVLQERKFRRVGGKEEIPIDVRVISATNRDLPGEVREGRFREDLFYRIHVVCVELPPLRDKAEDIPHLLSHFVDRLCKEMDKPLITLTPEASELLCRYSWPGNVRELQNVVKRAVALTQNDRITADDLPDELAIQGAESAVADGNGFFQLRARHVQAFEREHLSHLLAVCEGDVSKAAKKAQIPRGTFYRLLKKHQIAPEDFRPGS
ncbi:MAG: sigma-54-dependent transcriptional regulator [Planctomycetota bacterium]